jgi:glycosyltransferase involved in cell wall biosynthesis
MKVLLIAPTYGRLPYLGRLVASFASQKYDDKELVIINDDKNIQIMCEYPGVTCINLTNRILVTHKKNIAVSLGFHDLYMPHDDDDVFLPNRIQNHVNKFKENPDLPLYRNELAYILFGGDFKVSASGFNCISFTKKAWFEAGGYAHKVASGQDQEFINKIKSKIVEKNENEVDYVYNWSGLNYHLSSSKEHDITTIADKQLREMGLVGKKFYIQPDFEEYKKFVQLDEMYKSGRRDLIVNHQGMERGKIDIAHLIKKPLK